MTTNIAHWIGRVILCAALGASASSHALVAEEPGYGVRVSAGTAGNCPSFCTGVEFASQQDGGSTRTSASASESTYGTASGSASFATGASYLPELKAFASSALSRGADATSFGSQLFSYTGTGPRRVELAIDLTGSVTNRDVGYSSNTISASFAVVRGSSLPWGLSFSSLIFEAVNPEDVLGTGSLFIPAPEVLLTRGSLFATGPQALSASGFLGFDLAEGDSFFVVGQLTASSRNGVADASSTLKMSFDNAQNLVAVTAVPEPAAAWLAIAGLLVLWMRRRQAAA